MKSKHHCDTFEEFLEENPSLEEELLERICDARCKCNCSTRYEDDLIRIEDVHKHDVINCVITGEVLVGDKWMRFICEDGNWRGTVMLEWGTEETVGLYEPERPAPISFIPNDPHLWSEKPHMYKVYLYWRNQEWFKEKERGYNYDRFFQPGGYVEGHYEKWAKAKGMTTGFFEGSDLPKTEKELDERLGKLVPMATLMEHL